MGKIYIHGTVICGFLKIIYREERVNQFDPLIWWATKNNISGKFLLSKFSNV